MDTVKAQHGSPVWSNSEFEWDSTLLSATRKAPGSKRTRRGRPQLSPYACQICAIDLSSARYYHKRYRICEQHCGIEVQYIDGRQTRWCQQCGKFQPVGDFDGARRTCRAKLKQHAQQKSQRKQTASRPSRNGQQTSTDSGTISDQPSMQTPSGDTSEPSMPVDVRQASASAQHSNANDSYPAGLLMAEDRELSAATCQGDLNLLDPLTYDVWLPSAPLPGKWLPDSQYPIQDVPEIDMLIPDLQALFPSDLGGVPGAPPVWQLQPAEARAAQASAYTHSVAPPAQASAPGYQYQSLYQLHRWSLKLFGVTPDHLSPFIRDELEVSVTNLEGALVEGFIRPGCVHLTLDLLLSRGADAALQSPRSMAALAEELLDGRLTLGLPQPPHATLQLGGCVGVAQSGGASAMVLMDVDVMPRLTALSPLALSQRTTTVSLRGHGLREARIFCRAAGGFCEAEVVAAEGVAAGEPSSPAVEEQRGGPSVQPDESAELAGSSQDGGCARAAGKEEEEVTLRLVDLPVGCAMLELQSGNFLSTALALLVVPSEDVAEEVRRLELDSSAVEDVATFLFEVGLVLRHLQRQGGRGPSQPHQAALPASPAMVAAIAQRTAVAAAMFGWPALAELLLEAVTAGGVTAAAAANAMDALVQQPLPAAVPSTCAHADIPRLLAAWAAGQGLGSRWQPDVGMSSLAVADLMAAPLPGGSAKPDAKAGGLDWSKLSFLDSEDEEEMLRLTACANTHLTQQLLQQREVSPWGDSLSKLGWQVMVIAAMLGGVVAMSVRSGYGGI